MKIIKWCLLIPVALIVIGFIGTEVNKAYWDAKVRELCEKDGGVTVYETITLLPEEFNRLGAVKGVIPVPDENSSIASNSPYLLKQRSHVVNKSNPSVVRTEFVVYRVNDDKAFGKMVTYSRVGGDFPTGIMHRSSFSCGNLSNMSLDLEKQVFLLEGER